MINQIIGKQINRKIMEQYYTELFLAYFIINSLVFSYQVGQNDGGWRREDHGSLILLITAIVVIFFGIPVYSLMYLWKLAKKLWDVLNRYFQVYFWMKFYFTKQYEYMPMDRLQLFNAKIHFRFNKNTLPHKMYRKCVLAVNKKNDFIFLIGDYNKKTETVEF